ncbi:MAG TPA: HAD hydrolase-like protein [Gemmatimonadaceae bacterium]|jgi:phosphoglycolate phosphatase-like HAD superfamily hydrolase|nr:HAD hydrolase-like protein [Gemmatimonadaceae bacterium]
MKLILFDIDGTILWSDGAGRRAMTAALTRVFGGAGPTAYHYDGKTDPQIVRDLMRAEGHSDAVIDARMDDVAASYLALLEQELATGRRGMHVFDGVSELISALEARPDAVVGLLTGNFCDGAMLKLSAAGLDVTRFRVGAYGSDHAHRPELPAVALRRAREALGIDVRGEDVVVIGDTPADIECARSVGARAVAVATGRFTVEDLAAHAPAAVFPTLADTAAVLEAIFDA